MRRFQCPKCENEVHFDNRQCVVCTTQFGYLPSADKMLALSGGNDETYPCENRNVIGCNWLCEGVTNLNQCLSCRHTTKLPDLSVSENLRQFTLLERAKRQLFYSIMKFRLPLYRSTESAEGYLHFELLGDEIDSEGEIERVMTGHKQGRITINIAEADDATREKIRKAHGEPYRTLIGHFRHEIAHFYWDKLVAGKQSIDEFRAIFGDERADYSDALKVYYKKSAPHGWSKSFVSAYATAHPWEDFAETWAHYFHMISGLETAYAYGISPQPVKDSAPYMVLISDPFDVIDLRILVDHWVTLTVAMNEMNRSIGNFDYYPFVLSDSIFRKLKFVHDLIGAHTKN